MQGPAREMTLKEIVENLPEGHGARREYAVLALKGVAADAHAMAEKPTVPPEQCEGCVFWDRGYGCQSEDTKRAMNPWDWCRLHKPSLLNRQVRALEALPRLFSLLAKPLGEAANSLAGIEIADELEEDDGGQ